MSESFLGRWSNRKLQKKAPIEPEVTTSGNVSVEKDLAPDNGTALANEPIQLKNPSSIDGSSYSNSETNDLQSNFIPTIPESAAPSDNSIVEVVSEPVVEPPHPKTGEMDTSSEIDKDKNNNEPEPILSDADMPDIQSLDASSDVSAFFNRGVSKTLRNAALKHIFGLSSYNVRDGLNDYDEDYTVFEPLGDTVTCDMKFHKERKEKLEAERLEQERLEQERLLAEAEAEQKKDIEQQETDNAVATNDEKDDAELEQVESEQRVASSADEHSDLLESTPEIVVSDNSKIAAEDNHDADSLPVLHDESEHA